MPHEERTKWIVGIFVSITLGLASLAWGSAQWIGNRSHEVLQAKDVEIEKRLDNVEEAVKQIPIIAIDVAVIRGYLEANKTMGQTR